ncbi:type IV pilin protein [Candidatus Avelusimicrobium caledoniensis]|uniref:type IV pilin protein n=1 Tax=Candidatus Avelusimicrobium caledoniensis TaxID=3416220 RepID=UPI003D1396A3
MEKENVVLSSPLAGEDVRRTGEGYIKGNTYLNPLIGFECLRTQNHFPRQGGSQTASGFTLIELLVVVLIIGILAAVALPQYKMAVAKARASTLLGMMNAVKQAQETYYLANGSYANDINELSVSLPGQPSLNWPTRRIYAPGAWLIDINDSTLGAMGYDTRISGVKIYFFYDRTSHGWAGKQLCYATMSNDVANKICQNLTNRKTPNSDNGPNTENIYFFK